MVADFQVSKVFQKKGAIESVQLRELLGSSLQFYSLSQQNTRTMATHLAI